ncbi:MAG: MBG domain-containing protein, partial [Paraprevotella clara]|nr:MBG domain-containing protein [Paraprevotella clara]
MKGTEIKADAFGKDAKVEVTEDGDVVKVVVTDETAQDEKVNTYTLTFKGEQAVITLPEAAPSVTYGDAVSELGFVSNSDAAFTYSFSVGGVLEVGEDGMLHAVGSGEVMVTASQAGNDNFTSAVSEPLAVTVAKAPLNVSLSEDAWCWRGINVSASNQGNGKCGYAFVMDGLKGDDAGKAAEEIFTKLPTVKANAPKEVEKAGDTRAAALSGGEAANYSITLAEDAKFTVVKNKVGVYVRLGNNTLSSAYDYETYRTVKAAVGQEEYIFTVEYADAVYDDADVLAGMEVQPEVVCDVNKDAAIGEEFPVSVKLPGQVSFDNFDLVSIVPDVAKLVMAANPGVTVTVPEEVVYGDEFALASNELGITYISKVLTAGVVSMTSKGVVTAKKAGKAELVVITSATTKDDVEYGVTTTRAAFDVQKAPLTITAQDVTVKAGDELPEAYELAYEGWIGKDTVETVFEVVPVAVPELPVELVPGTYDIVVKVEAEPENYEVKTVNGTLTVEGNGDGVASVNRENAKVAYANGNLYVPCGGRVEIYALTGALVGRYEGTVIPVALRTNTLYIVKTQKGAFRLWVK